MTAIRRTIDAIWRVESATLTAGLARLVRDVGLAEELAQDALRRGDADEVEQSVVTQLRETLSDLWGEQGYSPAER